MTLAIKKQLTPTLDGSGQFTVTFGDFEKVVSAVAVLNEGIGVIDAGLISQVSVSLATNVVTVTVLKADLEQVTDANRDWEVAVTADLNLKTVTVIADCI